MLTRFTLWTLLADLAKAANTSRLIDRAQRPLTGREVCQETFHAGQHLSLYPVIRWSSMIKGDRVANQRSQPEVNTMKSTLPETAGTLVMLMKGLS
ncbi:hypothetical protein SRHO_G00255290 [Serrasalmus rhombeus]